MSAFLVILWMMFGIPTALIAHRKKLSVPAWACVGVTFGVFGLLIVMVAEPETATPRWLSGSGDNLSLGGC
ncbi:MAG: hypothetical protein ABWY45_13020 [Mycobacterium sp.]